MWRHRFKRIGDGIEVNGSIVWTLSMHGWKRLWWKSCPPRRFYLRPMIDHPTRLPPTDENLTSTMTPRSVPVTWRAGDVCFWNPVLLMIINMIWKGTWLAFGLGPTTKVSNFYWSITMDGHIDGMNGSEVTHRVYVPFGQEHDILMWYVRNAP